MRRAERQSGDASARVVLVRRKMKLGSEHAQLGKIVKLKVARWVNMRMVAAKYGIHATPLRDEAIKICLMKANPTNLLINTIDYQSLRSYVP